MRCLLPWGTAITVRALLFFPLCFSFPTFLKLGKLVISTCIYCLHEAFLQSAPHVGAPVQKQNDQQPNLTSGHVRRSRRSAGISAFALLTSACAATELQHWVICFKVISMLCLCVLGAKLEEGCGPGAAPSFRNVIHDNIMSSIKKYRWSKPHIKTWPIKYEYDPPPLIRSSDHIKRYNCDNVDTIVNSSSLQRFEQRVNDN